MATIGSSTIKHNHRWSPSYEYRFHRHEPVSGQGVLVKTFGGGIVISDEVAFVPVGSPVTVSDYSAMDFTGSQIGSFVIKPSEPTPSPKRRRAACSRASSTGSS